MHNDYLVDCKAAENAFRFTCLGKQWIATANHVGKVKYTKINWSPEWTAYLKSDLINQLQKSSNKSTIP